MRGKLIVIEGVDGAGKTTQMNLLAEKLRQQGKTVEIIKFPRYETFFGKQIRAYLDGEFGALDQVHARPASILYALDRMDAAKELRKKLKQGTYILCDRYFISNLAYQGAKLKDKEKRNEFIDWLKELELKRLKIVKEDLIVFLDLPVGHSSQAVISRGEKLSIHEENKEFMNETRNVYLELCKKNKKRCFVIDCMKNESLRKTIEEVANDIWNIAKDKAI